LPGDLEQEVALRRTGVKAVDEFLGRKHSRDETFTLAPASPTAMMVRDTIEPKVTPKDADGEAC